MASRREIAILLTGERRFQEEKAVPFSIWGRIGVLPTGGGEGKVFIKERKDEEGGGSPFGDGKDAKLIRGNAITGMGKGCRPFS